MKSLSSYVSSFRQRALAHFRRTDQVKADAAERKQRWEEVLSEHRKPLGDQPGSGGVNPGGRRT